MVTLLSSTYLYGCLDWHGEKACKFFVSSSIGYPFVRSIPSALTTSTLQFRVPWDIEPMSTQIVYFKWRLPKSISKCINEWRTVDNLFFKKGLSRLLFLLFRLFNAVDSKQMFSLNFADDWIRTAKRTLYQLSRFTARTVDKLIIALRLTITTVLYANFFQKVKVLFNIFTEGWESWSVGYGKRLNIEKSLVLILVPDTRWICDI